MTALTSLLGLATLLVLAGPVVTGRKVFLASLQSPNLEAIETALWVIVIAAVPNPIP